MAKQIDLNGYWLIEDNPVSKEGVFPYLGKQISPELEPEKIYMVYRPASELENPDTVESFNAVPFIDEHEMLGEGFTKYDDRPAGGVLYNVKADNGILLGDFKIYSESLKDEIANGKKELSLGYLCDYELSRGIWNGQRYDAIQKNIRGNHVALVNKGRMGADVRVYDKAITMDEMPCKCDHIKEIPSGDGSPNKSGANSSLTTTVDQGENMTKYVELEEVKAILKKGLEWGDEENPTEKLIAELLDEKAVEGVIPTPAGDEDPENKDDEKKSEAQDKCGKDEDDSDKKSEDEDEKEEEKKASEDEDDSEAEEKKKSEDEDEEEKKDDEAKKAEDAMPRQILKMIAKRDALVREVEPIIGSFACDEMTEVDAAVYACKKLGLQVSQDEALPCLRGYLAAHKSNKLNNKVYGLDSAISAENGIDKATQKYLKGE